MSRKHKITLSQKDIDDYNAGASQETIGARYGVSQCCVRAALVRNGVRIHYKHESGKFLHGIEVRKHASDIVRRYLTGENTPTLAREFRVSDRVILRTLRENGIKIRTAAESRTLRKKAGMPWFKRSRYERRGRLFIIPCPRCGQERLFDNAKKKARESLCRACGGKKHSASAQGIPLEKWEGYSCTWSKEIAHTKEYKRWRSDVLRRDFHECVLCGAVQRQGKKISAHHIERKIDNREAVFDVDNGVTLCMPCHAKLSWHEEIFAPLFNWYVGWRKLNPSTRPNRYRVLALLDEKKLNEAVQYFAGYTGEAPANPEIPGQAS